MISYSEQNGARNAMVSIMIGNLGLEKNVTEDSVNEKITPNLTISDQLSVPICVIPVGGYFKHLDQGSFGSSM